MSDNIQSQRQCHTARHERFSDGVPIPIASDDGSGTLSGEIEHVGRGSVDGDGDVGAAAVDLEGTRAPEPLDFDHSFGLCRAILLVRDFGGGWEWGLIRGRSCCWRTKLIEWDDPHAGLALEVGEDGPLVFVLDHHHQFIFAIVPRERWGELLGEFMGVVASQVKGSDEIIFKDLAHERQ